MQKSAFVASNPFCVGVLYLGSYNKYVSLLKTYSICLIWSRVRSGLLALHCPDSDMYHKSISGRSPRYQQHCVFLSLGPGAQDYVWTSILDYPCGLWETLIIENDSTWSEGQRKELDLIEHSGLLFCHTLWHLRQSALPFIATTHVHNCFGYKSTGRTFDNSNNVKGPSSLIYSMHTAQVYIQLLYLGSFDNIWKWKSVVVFFFVGIIKMKPGFKAC